MEEKKDSNKLVFSIRIQYTVIVRGGQERGDTMETTITLGNTYDIKYLDGVDTVSKEISPVKGYVKSFELRNLKNSPIYHAILNILENGSAILIAKYTTYSGVKNKYTCYYDCDHREIIDSDDSTLREKRYFLQLS